MSWLMLSFYISESEVPKDAILVGTKEIIEGDKKHMDTYYLLPGDKDHSRSRRIVERKTTKYEGIGPTDEVTGVPIIPRGVSRVLSMAVSGQL